MTRARWQARAEGAARVARERPARWLRRAGSVRRRHALGAGLALLLAAAALVSTLSGPAHVRAVRARSASTPRAAPFAAVRGTPPRVASFGATAQTAAVAQAAALRQATARLRAAAAARCAGHTPTEQQIVHRRWLSRVIVTEYYPAPERWFVGLRVPTPGMSGRHHVDWLYSASGLSMEGDGLDGAGRPAHIQDLGSAGWVNAAGVITVPPRCGIRWSHGPPAWRAGGWRNHAGQVTYPLADGRWSGGGGHWVGGYGGATFASGPSLPVRFYHSVAVDPRLIPEGSRIYMPDYRAVNGGWFVAQDTGGAIIGRHIDVYRPPPIRPFSSGRLDLSARVYVIPPGA